MMFIIFIRCSIETRDSIFPPHSIIAVTAVFLPFLYSAATILGYEFH